MYVMLARSLQDGVGNGFDLSCGPGRNDEEIVSERGQGFEPQEYRISGFFRQSPS